MCQLPEVELSKTFPLLKCVLRLIDNGTLYWSSSVDSSLVPIVTASGGMSTDDIGMPKYAHHELQYSVLAVLHLR